MSLDLNKLENRRELAGGAVQARCPACAEDGHDRQGEHLRVLADGRFGCCVYPKDREHRKRIFALAGDTASREIKIKTVVKVTEKPKVVSDVFGRLGRALDSPANDRERPDASDGVDRVSSNDDETRTARTGETNSIEKDNADSRTLRTTLNIYRSRGDDSSIKVQGVPVKASEPSENSGQPASAADSTTGVRGVRLPYINDAGDLVIPFDSPERFHWWKGGQRVALTEREARERKEMDGSPF